ncbi:hypothetical protein ACSQ67_022614 [Phaseolus vulgaris]
MGRPKDEEYWNQVCEEEDGRLKCKHCGVKFRGGVSRIKAHIDRIEGKGIRICSSLPNHITSSNHSQQHINVITTSQVVERVGEMTDMVGGSINLETVTGSTLLGEVEGGDLERVDNALNPERTASVEDYYEAGNGTLTTTLQRNLDVIISDLTSKEEDFQTQLQWLESHGKKRKREVDHWLCGLQDIKQFAIDMKNSLNQFECFSMQEEEIYLTEISEKQNKIQWLTKKVEEHEEEEPSVLSNEFVGSEFGKNVKKIQKLLKDDRVLIIGIYGTGGVGKTFLATYMHEKVGIPLGVKGIKLIITSRLKHVFQQMDCQQLNMISVNPFREYFDGDEAWELFLLKHGHRGTPSTLPPEVENIARYVVRACHGLPLGISVIARILKGKTDINWWRHVGLLNKHDTLEMGVEMQEEVLSVLRRSYDNLTEKNVQKCFLYSALLPNYLDIHDLITKLVDRGLLNGKRSLKEIFNDGNVVDKLLE